MNSKRLVYIGLGSNLGERHKALLQGKEALAALPETTLEKVSSLYETEPIGYTSQGSFLNAVLCLQTALAAEILLQACLKIEEQAGRYRGSHHKKSDGGPRTLDLDLLCYGGLVINNEPDLILPHPRLHERAFVLNPLHEITPNWRHPVSGKSAFALLRQLPPQDCIYWPCDAWKNSAKMCKY